MKIIFFGAGIIGKRMLGLWEQFSIRPDFFADNSKECWGTFYCGIEVLSLEQLRRMDDIRILITCKQIESISMQLLNYGIQRQNIFKGNTIYDMIIFWSLFMREKLMYKAMPIGEERTRGVDSFRILLDLQNGFVLGGVEEWAYKMAEIFVRKKFLVKYVITDFIKNEGNKRDEKILSLKYRDGGTEEESLKNRVNELKKNIPCNIICNFTGDTFRLACLAKLLWPYEVNLITVIHNDEEDYYERYSEMSELIDHCLVISSKIKKTIQNRGISETKIQMLTWNIPCDTKLNRVYSGTNHCICIGYAGRVVLKQKRMDLLLKIVKKLNKLEIDFNLEIAGTGNYLEDLKDGVDKESLQNRVKFWGYIPHEEISKFWRRQDIMVSCLELQGFYWDRLHMLC